LLGLTVLLLLLGLLLGLLLFLFFFVFILVLLLILLIFVLLFLILLVVLVLLLVLIVFILIVLLLLLVFELLLAQREIIAGGFIRRIEAQRLLVGLNGGSQGLLLLPAVLGLQGLRLARNAAVVVGGRGELFVG